MKKFSYTIAGVLASVLLVTTGNADTKYNSANTDHVDKSYNARMTGLNQKAEVKKETRILAEDLKGNTAAVASKLKK